MKINTHIKDILEIAALFVFFIIFVRGCKSCSKNYHNEYGLKGWGESVLFGDKYIKNNYENTNKVTNEIYR